MYQKQKHRKNEKKSSLMALLLNSKVVIVFLMLQTISGRVMMYCVASCLQRIELQT